MGQVELDGATATRLEVDEHQPVLRAEHVPGMWLAVQQLLGRAAVDDRLSHVSEGADQKLSVVVGERGCAVFARDKVLGLRDSIREVRRRDVLPSHALMQPLEGLRVVGWRDVVLRCPGLVVGPQRHREAVTLVDARLHPRLESGHGAVGSSEPLSEVDFERCNLLPCMSDPGEDIARQQTQGDLVRVLERRSRCQRAGRALQQSRWRLPSHA